MAFAFLLEISSKLKKSENCIQSSSSSAYCSRNSPTSAGSDEYDSFLGPGSYDKIDAINESLTLMSEFFPIAVSEFTKDPVESVRGYATMVLRFLQLLAKQLRQYLETDVKS
jgi:hypothetical protein